MNQKCLRILNSRQHGIRINLFTNSYFLLNLTVTLLNFSIKLVNVSLKWNFTNSNKVFIPCLWNPDFVYALQSMPNLPWNTNFKTLQENIQMYFIWPWTIRLKNILRVFIIYSTHNTDILDINRCSLGRGCRAKLLLTYLARPRLPQTSYDFGSTPTGYVIDGAERTGLLVTWWGLCVDRNSKRFRMRLSLTTKDSGQGCHTSLRLTSRLGLIRCPNKMGAAAAFTNFDHAPLTP